jgi:hypothetical protein
MIKKIKKFLYEGYVNYLAKQLGIQSDCLDKMTIYPRDSFIYILAEIAYEITEVRIILLNGFFEKTMRKWEKEL